MIQQKNETASSQSGKSVLLGIIGFMALTFLLIWLVKLLFNISW